MPVDPVSLESSVKFVRGSHKWGKWFHPRKFASKTNYPVESEQFEEKIFHDVPVEDIEGGKYEVRTDKTEYCASNKIPTTVAELGVRTRGLCCVSWPHSSRGQGQSFKLSPEKSSVNKVDVEDMLKCSKDCQLSC